MSYSSITYVMIKEEYRKYLFYFCNIKLYITLKDNHSAHSPFIEEQERFYEIIENDILGAALNNAWLCEINIGADPFKNQWIFKIIPGDLYEKIYIYCCVTDVGFSISMHTTFFWKGGD